MSKRRMPVQKPAREETVAPVLEASFLASLIGFNLRLAETVLYRDFSATMGEFDLTQRQSAVLILIGSNPAVSQTGLARFLDTDRATMMAMIDRLEARNLVERRTANRDRRAQALFLTPSGEKTCANLKRNIQKHEKQFVDRYAPRELRSLIALLSRLHGKF